METTENIDTTNIGNPVRRSRPVVLLTGMVVVLAITLGFTFWRSTKQEKEITTLETRWVEHTNAVVNAKAEEHARVKNGFMTTNEVTWKVVFDQAKEQNMVEVRALNPLKFHKAGFVVSMVGRTETYLKDGRRADPRPVSIELAFNGLAPAESAVQYVKFPATVETRATGFIGKILDWFRFWGLPTTEAPIDAQTLLVRVFNDHAEMADEVWVRAGTELARTP